MSRLFASVLLVAAFYAGLEVSEAGRNFLDLTYTFNNETVLFPGRKSTFNVEFEGYTAAGYWVAAKGFCTSEHTSTHVDAPYHFNQNGRTLDQIPLEDLIDIEGVMIDIYDKVHVAYGNELMLVPNYALTREDILEWERRNGRVPTRSVVLVRSGWGARWPNSDQYLGAVENKTEDKRTGPLNPDTDLNYPGFDPSAAKFLVTERGVLGVGIDTISIDTGSGTSKQASHIIFAARNVYMIENVANLHLLPPRGFKLWMLPFKIDRGTGAPLRIIARLGEEIEENVVQG